MKRTPINRKRPLPRRNEGRVGHKRIKSKASAPPTVEQQLYWCSLPASCVACGATETVLHHILQNLPGKKSRRDHWFVVRLCPKHHNMGTVSVHLLGSEEAFRRATGIDLCVAASENLKRWQHAQRAD